MERTTFSFDRKKGKRGGRTFRFGGSENSSQQKNGTKPKGQEETGTAKKEIGCQSVQKKCWVQREKCSKSRLGSNGNGFEEQWVYPIRMKVQMRVKAGRRRRSGWGSGRPKRRKGGRAWEEGGGSARLVSAQHARGRNEPEPRWNRP